MSASKTIAIITGSTRPVRVGPNVADFVQNIIEAKADLGDYKIVPVRLADFNLPVLNETQMPGMILKPEDYEHEHSRRWSTEIQKHAAYILVSPEYNWGMPGGVKNAIDYLFNEWKGKPIAIVTYGIAGHNASSQLSTVLGGQKLQVAPTKPVLSFNGANGPSFREAAGKGIITDDSRELWEKEKTDDLLNAFKEIKELLESPPAEPVEAKA